LTDTELLAIVIGKGFKNTTALDIAKQIIRLTGSLKSLSQKTVGEVEQYKIKGLGRAKIVTILAALEAGRRSLLKKADKKTRFKSPEDIYKHYYPLIGGLKNEVFKVVAVDGKNAMIHDYTISKGIRDASLAHPFEIFKFALNQDANAIFLVHNHPSGILRPSDDDLKITERICQAGEIMGVRIVDHVIVCEDDYFSFSQHHLL